MDRQEQEQNARTLYHDRMSCYDTMQAYKSATAFDKTPDAHFANLIIDALEERCGHPFYLGAEKRLRKALRNQINRHQWYLVNDLFSRF